MEKQMAVRRGRLYELPAGEQLEKKRVSYDEILPLIQNGDVICSTGGAIFPDGFQRRLAEYIYREDLHISYIAPFQLTAHEITEDRYKNNANFYSFFFGAERSRFQNGNIHYIPIHLGETGDMLLKRKPRVVVMTCTLPDKDGWMSRSIWGSHIHRRVLESPDCEIVIAEVNSNLPYTLSDGEGHTMVHISEIDYMVENDFPLQEIKTRESTRTEKAIAGYISEMIRDGDCLQLGQGGLADAIGMNLIDAHKKDLGYQAEVLTNSVAALMKAGVVNNSRKNLYRGVSVAAAVVGDRALWDFVHNNPEVCIKEIDWVNKADNIKANDNTISINNAMEIDLVGQTASEAIGPRQYTGTGGQLEWVYGAQCSKGGRSIIALNSSYHDRQGCLHSKIKPVLPLGSIVTTPRTSVQFVVTEYGTADLKYRSTQERAKSLIAIAHPAFREELRFEAKKYGWII